MLLEEQAGFCKSTDRETYKTQWSGVQ